MGVVATRPFAEVPSTIFVTVPSALATAETRYDVWLRLAGTMTEMLVGRLAPAARLVNARRPTSTPAPGLGGGAAGARKNFTLNAPAAASPALWTVKATVIGRPSPIVAGPETAVIARSGRNATTCSELDATAALLAPLVLSPASPVSATTLVSSATAERKYVAGAVAAGMITLAAAVVVAPAARLATLRPPMRVPEPGALVVER